MRTTAANVAARQAVGGSDMLSKWQLMAEQARQKREGLDVGAASQQGRGSGSRPSPKLGKGPSDRQDGQKRSHSAAFGTGKASISFLWPSHQFILTIQSWALSNPSNSGYTWYCCNCSRHEKTWQGWVWRSATNHLGQGRYQCPWEGAPDDEITADLPAIRAAAWRFYHGLGWTSPDTSVWLYIHYI
jgi:hypothetical protein